MLKFFNRVDQYIFFVGQKIYKSELELTAVNLRNVTGEYQIKPRI